ncbi:MAG: hypothetical protein ACI4MB_04675 [Candidatus Coproplasma sp.]
MDKKKVFVCIFAGVMAAGALVLGAGFIVRALVTGNAVVTVVTLFAIIAGAIMLGLGLISMLICLLIMTFSIGKKIKEVEENTTEELSEDKTDEKS